MILPLSLAAAGATVSAHTLGAQTDVTVEVGASQIGPPLHLDAESARFGVAGVRASHYGSTGAGLYGSVLAGRTFGDTDGGDFVTASLGGTMAAHWTSAVRVSLNLRMLAFGVRAPYPYSAVAIEGGSAVRFGAEPVSLEVAALAGVGSSRFEVPRATRGAIVFEDDLARLGGTTELTLGSGPIRFGAAAGLHDTPGGTFTSGGARLLFTGSWGAVELRGDVWRTPWGTDTTGGLALVIPLSGWSVRGFFGRSEPDPLTLAEPGSASAGVLLGRSVYARSAAPDRGLQPWEVLSARPGGATVRISIEAPEEASAVELLGDFTFWDPVPMQRRGGRWEAEVEVATGTHHYGFLVDDEWYVPDDTRDVVPDEWGRMSAILVIEGVE